MVRRLPGDRARGRHVRPRGPRLRGLVGRRGRLRGRRSPAPASPTSARPRLPAATVARARTARRWASSLSRDDYVTAVERVRDRDRGRRGLPGQPLPGPLRAAAPPDADVVGLAGAAGERQPRAVRRGAAAARPHGVEVATASPELFLRRRRRRGRVRADQGHRPDRGRPAGQGPRRERDDRRPGPQRPRPGRGHRLGRPSPSCARVEEHPGLVHLVSTVRGELRAGRRLGGAPRGDVPARLGHRRAQVQRAADHRRAGAGAARALLRRRRLGRRRPARRRASPSASARSGSTVRHAVLRHRRGHHLGLRPASGSGTRPSSRRPGCSRVASR